MLFDKDSSAVTMHVQEACDLGLIEQSDLDFFLKANLTKLSCSQAFVQDSILRKKTLYMVRGGPIDPRDAIEWRRVWKLLKHLDIDAAARKYNVRFERDEWETPAYQDPLGWSEENGWS